MTEIEMIQQLTNVVDALQKTLHAHIRWHMDCIKSIPTGEQNENNTEPKRT